MERGKLYQHGKDHPKAIADFTAAIVAKPEYAEAHFRRALSHYETGANANAIIDCSKAIELNPNPVEYYYYRGLAHLAARTWDKAATDLAAALNATTNIPMRICTLHGRTPKWSSWSAALREYTIAIQQRPGFPEAYKGAPSSRQRSGIDPGRKKTWQSSPAEFNRAVKIKRQQQFT